MSRRKQPPPPPPPVATVDARIEAAAFASVAEYMTVYGDSVAAEMLWENNPELDEHEAIRAASRADVIAAGVRVQLNTLAKLHRTQHLEEGPTHA